MVTSSDVVAWSAIDAAGTIFWDFDGVIKDSAKIKMFAYTNIFGGISAQQKNELITLYESSGGMSRFELIPFFFRHIHGRDIDPEEFHKKKKMYSDLVVSSVIQSQYIPGVERVIKEKRKNSTFVIVTNTPKSEIITILSELKILSFFDGVYGAPTTKVNALRDWISKYPEQLQSSVFIGDSAGDAAAAASLNIPFIHRGAPKESTSLSIENFLR